MSLRQYQLVECGAPLRLARTERPRAQGTQVVVRVLAAGVCHTDLHLSDGYFDLGGGKRVSLVDRGIRLPHTLGHEIAGEVIEAGPDASSVHIGDRVLVYPWSGCAACARCEAGEGHLCGSPQFLGVFRPGGFASHAVVPHPRYLFPLHGIPAHRAAPLACSGLTAFSALRKARGAHGRLGFIGAGGLGLMALGLLRLQGRPGAHVIEPDAGKRAAAMALGAASASGPTAGEIDALKVCVGEGLDTVIDFVGSPQSVAQGVDLLAKGGKLIVVGMYGGEITLPIPGFVLRSIAIEGSYVGSLEEMSELMTLVRESGVPEMPLQRRPLDAANEALAAVRAGRVVGRTVLEPTFDGSVT